VAGFVALSGVIVDLLATVLKIKVGFTLIFWSLPLLLLSDTWFVWMGMPEPEPMVFLRLLGAAFLALVVGYTSGLRRLRRGEDVRNIIWVGITSNGSASLILLLYGMAGAWEEWDVLARSYMWLSALVTALITFGLVAGLFRGGRQA
jgi:hypothetical protein